MAAPKKFSPEQMKAAIPVQGAPSRFSASQMASAVPAEVPQDVLTNPQGQGTYQMVSKEGQSVYVPFGKVLDAGKYGFAITPDDFKRFTKDYTASLPLRERMDEALQPADESTWAGRGLNVVRGTAAGLSAPFAHPVATAESTWQQLKDALPEYQWTRFGPIPAPNPESMEHGMEQAKQVEEHPFYSVSQVAGPMLVAEGIKAHAPEGIPIPGTAALKEMGERAKERLRQFTREQLGMPTRMRETIARFGKESEDTRTANKANTEATQKARGTVDTTRDLAAKKHEQDLADYEKKKAEKKAKFEQEHKDWEDRQQEAIRAHRQAVQDTSEAHTKALNEHIEAQKADQAAKQSAADELDERKGLEHKLSADQQELFERAQGARPQAEAVNDALWDAWRDSTKGQTTSVQPITDAIKQARESRLLGPTDVAEFNKILKESAPASSKEVATLRDQIAINQGLKNYDSGTPAQKSGIDNAVRSYGLDPDAADIPADADATRIHVWKQQLERAVRKAESSGNQALAGAFGQVLDQVRAAEDNLTANAGPNSSMLLDMARRQHQNLAEAFRDTDIERNPKTAQNIVIKEHAEDIAKANQKAEALRRMSIHDPEIAAKADEIKAAEKRLAEMRKPEALQKIIDAPSPVKPPPPEVPKYEDFSKKVGEEPTEPDYGKPPENPLEKSDEELYPKGLAYGEPKATEPMPEAGPYFERDINFLNDALSRYGRMGPWVFRLIVGAPFHALAMAMERGPSATEAGYTFSSSVGIGQGALMWMTHILRSGDALKWMMRPTDKEIEMMEKLPPEDAERLRIALKVLGQEEIREKPQNARIKINPALAAFLGGQPSTWKHEDEKQSLKQLQGEMEKRNPKNSRTQARTPGVTHVYDPDQGKIVPVQ